MTHEGKYLVTTDNWFYAPDGKKYRSAWGAVAIVNDEVLGVQTNHNSTNWYAQIGTGERAMLIAGCQIHYAVRCDKCPNTDPIEDVSYSSSGFSTFERPCEIYVAE